MGVASKTQEADHCPSCGTRVFRGDDAGSVPEIATVGRPTDSTLMNQAGRHARGRWLKAQENPLRVDTLLDGGPLE